MWENWNKNICFCQKCSVVLRMEYSENHRRKTFLTHIFHTCDRVLEEKKEKDPGIHCRRQWPTHEVVDRGRSIMNWVSGGRAEPSSGVRGEAPKAQAISCNRELTEHAREHLR